MSKFPPSNPDADVLAVILSGKASPVRTAFSIAVDDRLKLGHKSVKYVLTGPDRGFVTPLEPPLQKQRRRAVLADEIAVAMSTAANSESPNSVFVELMKLAERKYGCLIGLDDDVIKYQLAGVVKFFTAKQLRSRMDRARAEKKSR